MRKKSALLFGVLVVILPLIVSACVTADTADEGVKSAVPEFVPDRVDELFFDQNSSGNNPSASARGKPPASLPGAAFRIEISSSDYKVVQLRYTDRISYLSDDSRESPIRDMVARYDRVNTRRAGHVIVSVYSSSGRLMKYRFVRSTFVREFDSIILRDLSSLRFRVKKGVPATIYITYVITVSHTQEPAALP